MKLTVISGKHCWLSPDSPSGYVTDGGFPMQMQALSELFDVTTLVVPCSAGPAPSGVTPLAGHNLSVTPLAPPAGAGLARKAGLLFWLAQNGPVLLREVRRADAVHTPIPGDVSSLGMLLAFMLRKPLFVRHCGNWFAPRTVAEHFWQWFIERFAGGLNVMLATGGAPQSPSRRNPAVRWIFASSLTRRQLDSLATHRTGPNGECPRLIIACRQEPDKGTDVVIESLPLILHDFPGATLDVVGDGAALAGFKKLAAHLGVSQRVTFHGKVEHSRVLTLLQQADLLCYPTTASEGFPKIVHEALACGLPVITSRVSVLPQLIGRGCGILLDEVTPSIVAQAVHASLSDPEGYRLMSAQATETAGCYSRERWRDTIGNFLQQAWGPLRTPATYGRSPDRALARKAK